MPGRPLMLPYQTDVWKKAGFKTVTDVLIKHKITKLHQDYSKLRKNSNTSKILEKVQSCFDIGSKDLKDVTEKDRKRC